jgi:hypothetical protein
MTELNIVCFLWHGDRWNQDDDGEKYVNVLYRAVQRNLNLPHRFICFSNISTLKVSNGIDILPMNSLSWKGCLPRLWMYSPEATEMLGENNQVLSLDLDVVIVRCMDEIASYRGDFCVRSKFHPAKSHKADGDIVGFRVGSCNNIWNEFIKEPQKNTVTTGGRERWWYRRTKDCKDRWQNLFPGQVISYKRHVQPYKSLPEGAVIVSCHGHPRPHEIDEPWIKEHWR